MSLAIFEETKAYIGFSSEDAARLRALKERLAPSFPTVVERFYQVLMGHPGAARVFTGAHQVERLKSELGKWLTSLFSGVYDRDYCLQRLEIGRTHVRVGLAQHYMFAALEVIRGDLQAAILALDLDCPQGYLDALHRLLALETAVMLETYKESLSEQVRDVERVALHDRLIRAEHLAQIGQMAAALAHEIKNPLAGISSAVQVIQSDMSVSDSRQPVLAEVLRLVERLDGIVEDLLVYARPKPPRLRSCEIPAIIARAVDLIHQKAQAQRVEVVHEPVAVSLNAQVDGNQIEQVLVNIVLNAVHASREGQEVRVSARADNTELIIEVVDDGQGMSDVVRRKAFEPFFTTKVRGTGLGLAICQQIISAHGGSMELISAPGKGTRAIIRLPLQPEHAASPEIDGF